VSARKRKIQRKKRVRGRRINYRSQEEEEETWTGKE
jgi:hypothetical protein